MTGPEGAPPRGPDGAPLTPEEWEAVRRLREQPAAPAQPVAPEPPATEPPAPEPLAPEPLVAEPVAPEPVAPEPVAPEPVAPEPPAAEPPAPEPLAPEPLFAEPVALEPVAPEPVAEPVAPEPVAPEPVAPQPVTPHPVAAEPVTPPTADEWASASEPPAASAAPSPMRRGGVLLPALGALVALAIVAVALLAVVTVRLSDRHGQSSDGTAALSAATSGVATVLSYNYKSLDNDFAKAEALLTPSFRKSYAATTAKAVQPLAAKYHAVSSAQVTAGGVISVSGSRVQVLVFVSQQETNSQLSAPRLDRSRIVVDLKRSKGRWLIDKLNPV